MRPYILIIFFFLFIYFSNCLAFESSVLMYCCEVNCIDAAQFTDRTNSQNIFSCFLSSFFPTCVTFKRILGLYTVFSKLLPVKIINQQSHFCCPGFGTSHGFHYNYLNIHRWDILVCINFVLYYSPTIEFLEL